ncbi:MAG: hypothetical protein DRJ67_00330 [Thermoprotei archaeon]|nr:MAG: hypothetical protein DRJ67_00330 [Thermoprotei archaeon]
MPLMTRLRAFLSYALIRLYLELHPATMKFEGLHIRCPQGCFPPRGVISTSLLARACRPFLGLSPALDLGTGVGALALILARGGSYVVGVDLNPACLRIAALNAKLNGLHHLIDVVACDGASALRRGAFRLILVNPPYLPLKPRSLVDAQVCGGRALELVTRLLAWAMYAAAPGGVVLYALSTLSGKQPSKAKALLTARTPLERIAVYLTRRAKFNRLQGWHNAVR